MVCTGCILCRPTRTYIHGGFETEEWGPRAHLEPSWSGAGNRPAWAAQPARLAIVAVSEDFVAGLPKAELHVHHVGSVSQRVVAELAARGQLLSPEANCIWGDSSMKQGVSPPIISPYGTFRIR